MGYFVILGATGYSTVRCALRGFNDSLRAVAIVTATRLR